ncbi:MAG: DUF2157 domain-containing protein [Thiomargarita sp.]|nr:DUF2157 domain-containing protein [Thiomargarita sp.]
MVPLERPPTSQDFYTLARHNYLTDQALEYALRRIGTVPDATAWQQFIDKTLLFLSTALILSGIIFFFAYNWADMSYPIKFAVLQCSIVIMALFASLRGLKHLSGQSALLAASVLVGALLAVFGQTYQTGADAFSLFLGWAFLILPWVILSRFLPMWLLFCFLINLSLILYWEQVINYFFWNPPIALFLLLFSLNFIVMLVWEFAYRRGVAWVQGEWFGVILFCAVLITIIIPSLYAIAEGRDWQEHPLFVVALLLYILTTALILWYYRFQRRDLLFLTLSLFGIVIVMTTFIGRLLPWDVFSWLFLALVIIGQATIATKWMQKISGESY